MDDFDFLTHRKLNDRLYLVQESYLNRSNLFNIYVAAGKEKAAVFDTGLGVTAGLRRYIEKYITDKKPMHAFITHVDLDHSGGALLFDKAYLNERENEKLEWNLNVERRFSDLSVFCRNNKEVLDYCKDRYIHNEGIRFQNIDEGDVIDLGEMKFEVIKIPGHTPGSLAYYNREENYVITGDAVQHHNTLQRCPDLEVSLAYYESFIEKMPKDVVIYTGHEDQAVGIETVCQIKEGIEEILSGKTKQDVPSKMPFPMVDPEELEYTVMQHEYKSVIILYNAKSLE